MCWGDHVFTMIVPAESFYEVDNFDDTVVCTWEVLSICYDTLHCWGRAKRGNGSISQVVWISYELLTFKRRIFLGDLTFLYVDERSYSQTNYICHWNEYFIEVIHWYRKEKALKQNLKAKKPYQKDHSSLNWLFL